MWEDQEGLKGLIRQLDDLKESLVYRWGVLEYKKNKKRDAEARKLPSIYPNATGKPILVNGYPVFRFSYQGMLPPYEKENTYKTRIRDYYLRATLDAYDWKKVDIQFEKAGLLIAHYFKSKMVRDLDNRNRKYLQDGLRATGLIKDDSWRDLSCLEMGFPSENNHVQMYVMDDKNFPDFHAYMKKHHLEVMKQPEITQDEYVEAIKKSNRKRQEKIYISEDASYDIDDIDDSFGDDFWDSTEEENEGENSSQQAKSKDE
ncbi:hypothetical protein [Lentibacillus salinarum]|uniref:Uncharacterized protein n=1 Tax=Lentibacillus salinarum TaxID=446820 RepID=A0ABW3ZWY0_9BACI